MILDLKDIIEDRNYLNFISLFFILITFYYSLEIYFENYFTLYLSVFEFFFLLIFH